MKSLLRIIGVMVALAWAFSAVDAAVKSLDLGGSVDYVHVPDDSSIDIGTSDLTIEAWVKTTQGAGYHRVISKGHYGLTHGYMLQISDSGKVLGGISADTTTTGYWAYVNTPTVNDNAWHHVAVVFDRSATSGATAYIDGVAYSMTVGGGTWTNDQYGNIANNRNLRIGRRDGSTVENYDGLVDDVRIWTEARSLQEIQASYLVRPSSYDANLAAYWDFDDNLTDHSGNSNNGTAYGGATYSATAAPLKFPIAHWQFGEAEDISYDINRSPQASDVTNHWTGNMLVMNQAETVDALGSDNRVLKEMPGFSFAACDAGDTELDITGAVSMFARVKAGEFDGVDDIARADVSASENQYALEFLNGTPRFRIRGVTETSDSILGFDQVVSTDTWYDIVGVFEPTGSTGQMSLYVSEAETGLRLGSVSQTVGFASLIDLPNNAYFHIFESPQNFNGENVGFELEQLAVWNVALDESDVFLLTKIPEPDAIVLLLLGGAALVFLRRRFGR